MTTTPPNGHPPGADPAGTVPPADDSPGRRRRDLEAEEEAPDSAMKMLARLGRRLMAAQAQTVHELSQVRREMEYKALLRAFDGDHQRVELLRQRSDESRVQFREHAGRALAYGLDYLTGQLDALQGAVSTGIERARRYGDDPGGMRSLADLVERMATGDASARAGEQAKWFLRLQLVREHLPRDLADHEWKQFLRWALDLSPEMPEFLRALLEQAVPGDRPAAPAPGRAGPPVDDDDLAETLVALPFEGGGVLRKGGSVRALVKLENRSLHDLELDCYVGNCVVREPVGWSEAMGSPWPDLRYHLPQDKVVLSRLGADRPAGAAGFPDLVSAHSQVDLELTVRWDDWFAEVWRHVAAQARALAQRLTPSDSGAGDAPGGRAATELLAALSASPDEAQDSGPIRFRFQLRAPAVQRVFSGDLRAALR